MSYQVFISYSHVDNQIAQGLCYKLEDEGVQCWIAPRDIKAGDVWARAISKAIPKCKIMLLVLSSNSNASDQVLREVELAVQKKLVVVPIRIDDIMPTDGMSYYLSTTQWIDIKGKHIDSKFSIISKQIKDILGIVEEKSAAEVPKENKTEIKPKDTKQKSGIDIKRLVFIILPILTIVIACIALIINWNTLFNKDTDLETAAEESETPTEEVVAETTPEITEPVEEESVSVTAEPEEPAKVMYTANDLGMSPDEQISFSDENLDDCIGQTLQHMGYDANERSIESILQIETLIISTQDAEETFLLAGIEREVMLSGYEDYYKCVADNIIYSLDGLEYARNLRNLVITGQSFGDLSMLQPLDKLEVVYLPNNHIDNIESLANKPDLRIIGLDNNNISDISVLGSSAASATHLYLYGCKSIKDFNVIAEFDELIALGLSDTSVNNVEAFKDLKNLVALRLRFTDMSNWQDLGTIASIETLESLYISDTDIDDIGFLSNYTNLQDLYSSNTNIADIQVLKNLDNLKYVNIMNTNVEDFSVFDNMNIDEIYMNQKLYDNNIVLGQKLIVNGSKIYTENGYVGD